MRQVLLKKLKLKNIRSYKEGEVEFPRGIILFEGDVGSGKSSILYAIEFALFGLGDMRADSLLRMGEDKGEVELEFEVGKKLYKVRRSLIRRKESIAQGKGYLECDGVREVLSPSELREKVLQILNFKESPRPKASSVIFRYAIFTPQEEMKAILNLKSEERLQTLRKAFGIEEYKLARDNLKLVISELRSRANYIAGEIADLGELEKRLAELEERKSLLEEKIKRLEQNHLLLESKSRELEARVAQLEQTRIEVERLKAEIESVSSRISERERELELQASRVKRLVKELQELNAELEAARSRVPEKVEIDEHSLLSMKEEKEQKKRELQELAAELKVKLENFEELLERGICPTCERPVESKEFGTRISELRSRLSNVRDSLEKLERELKTIEHRREEIREWEHEKERIELLSRNATRLREEMDLIEERMGSLEKELEELRSMESERRQQLKSKEPILDQLKDMIEAKNLVEIELRKLLSELNYAKGELQALLKEEERTREDLERKRKLKLELERFEECRRWLGECLVPAFEEMEKAVMVSINREFDSLFRKYFNMLMESEELNVRIDEEFSPIVEQNGYEIDVNSLSGGERTSVAFAYRIALNLMVQRVCTSMKENLLILDEPTDGFSKEQIFRMREVLRELNCDQIIIVSHERELEGFVDKVFRVEKVGGESRIIA